MTAFAFFLVYSPLLYPSVLRGRLRSYNIVPSFSERGRRLPRGKRVPPRARKYLPQLRYAVGNILEKLNQRQDGPFIGVPVRASTLQGIKKYRICKWSSFLPLHPYVVTKYKFVRKFIYEPDVRKSEKILLNGHLEDGPSRFESSEDENGLHGFRVGSASSWYCTWEWHHALAYNCLRNGKLWYEWDEWDNLYKDLRSCSKISLGSSTHRINNALDLDPDRDLDLALSSCFGPEP